MIVITQAINMFLPTKANFENQVLKGVIGVVKSDRQMEKGVCRGCFAPKIIIKNPPLSNCSHTKPPVDCTWASAPH